MAQTRKRRRKKPLLLRASSLKKRLHYKVPRSGEAVLPSQNQNIHQLLKVGITGGIGSGKSIVCRLFEDLGIPVYDADRRAKFLMHHDRELIDRLKEKFGAELYEEGKLNTALLAAKVFPDSEKLAWLNKLIHPAVFRDTERWLKEQVAKGAPYILKESALMVETGAYKSLDKLIVVTAPEELRLQRVQERSGLSREQVKARMARQLPDAEKMKVADFVLVNDGGINQLKPQVQKIHQQLMAWNQNKTI